MQNKKHFFVRALFLVELCLFVYGYGWGRSGIINWYGKKRANQALLEKIAYEKKRLEDQKEYLLAWQRDPFYKEQFAREQLQMARKDEIIYINS